MRTKYALSLLAVACLALLGAGDKQPGDKQPGDREALSSLQVYVGAWRGVGQPRRGSTAGAWTEQAEWAWKFSKDETAIAFTSPKGKYFRGGHIVAGERPNEFGLVATSADGEATEHFSGSLQDGKLVFEAQPRDDQPAEGRPARITIRTVADGDRLLVLLESRREGTERYARMAEVGYTRKGSSFGKGSTGPECVVTGGYGSIEVAHMGKKYYVCCSGCRDLFNEDPETVLAEYRERKQKERDEPSD